MKVLAIIAARGGSKGLPRKNVLPLAGRPLIAHSIAAAHHAASLDRVIVSTDDEEIATVAKAHGAEVPFVRPDELSDDKTASTDVCQHAIDHLKATDGYQADAILLLQPTSPLRTAADIDAAVDLMGDTGATSIIGIKEVCEYPEWMKTLGDGMRLCPRFPLLSVPKSRQELGKTFIVNGAIYLTTAVSLEQSGDFYGSDPRGYIMPRDRSIDIDSEIDFEFAELLIRRSSDTSDSIQ